MTFNFNFESHQINLFAYYLSEKTDSLGEYSTDWLWDKCNRIVNKTLGNESEFDIKQHLDLENESDELWANLNKHVPHTDDYYPIYVEPNRNGFYIEDYKIDFNRTTGIIYPVQLYDSYGLGLKLIFPKLEHFKQLEKADFDKVNPENCLFLDAEDKNNQSFLGQTLLITIKLKTLYKLKFQSNKKKLKNIANNYINSLFPANEKKPPFNCSGELFGSPIFEYGIIRQFKRYNHVIIWFTLDNHCEKLINNNYHQLLDLFLFRAKIIHAYKHITDSVIDAKDKSQEIHSKIKSTQHSSQKDNELHLDLSSLHNLLIELPELSVDYSEKVRFIKEFQNIIVENTRNYSDKIHEIESNFPDEDLSFLHSFTERNSRPFQERVRASVNFFQLDTNLINNAIDSIKGQLAIEQAHRERKLQTTITSLGIGIAAAGNFASSYEAGSIAENKKPTINAPHYNEIKIPFINKQINLTFHIYHFMISFILSMLAGFIVWQTLSRLLYWRYKKEQLTKTKTK